MRSFHARISEDHLREHHLRMQRVALIALPTCAVIGVAAVLITPYLAVASLVAGIGAFIAIDILLRARRGLKEPGDLLVVIEGNQVTTERSSGGAGTPQPAPLMGAQVFPDHVQLVAGDAPTRARQIELPLEQEERRRLVELLRTQTRIPVGERRSVGVHIFTALTIVPAAVIALYLAYRALVLTVAFGVLEGLRALGGTAALAGLAVLAALGFWILGRRFRG